jgi:hypothetical protein
MRVDVVAVSSAVAAAGVAMLIVLRMAKTAQKISTNINTLKVPTLMSLSEVNVISS